MNAATKSYLETKKHSFLALTWCDRCMEKTSHTVSKSQWGGFRATCGNCGKGAKMKYNSTRTEYNGRWYDSGAEAQYAAELDMRMRAGEIEAWVPQKRFEFVVNGVYICSHKVDFELTMSDGTIELHEVKGRESEDWRIRKNLLLATIVNPNPNMTYQVIKV